jgi:hypothetical protein
VDVQPHGAANGGHCHGCVAAVGALWLAGTSRCSRGWPALDSVCRQMRTFWSQASRGRFVLVDAGAAAVWVPLAMTCGAALIALVLGEGSLSLEAWL